MLGHADAAHQLAREAVQRAQALVAVDPQNKTWLGQLYIAQIWLADAQMALGDRAGARANSQVVLAGSARLVALDSKLVNWQVRLRGLALELAARLAADDERPVLIDSFRDYLATVRQFTTDRGLPQASEIIVAQAESQLGVLLAAEGKAEEASRHWRAVVARVKPAAERGDLPAVTVLATAEARLGALAPARALAQRVESTPYRHPTYAALVKMLGGVGPPVSQP
jgi:hypothetical protein